MHVQLQMRNCLVLIDVTGEFPTLTKDFGQLLKVLVVPDLSDSLFPNHELIVYIVLCHCLRLGHITGN